MHPTLSDGDVVYVKYGCTPAAGDVLYLRHPYRTDLWLIKRVVSLDSQGDFYVLGDNPESSTDSKTFGMVPKQYCIGVVCSTY
jgi:nickel-type superoxide dismutase maturation protease